MVGRDLGEPIGIGVKMRPFVMLIVVLIVIATNAAGQSAQPRSSMQPLSTEEIIAEVDEHVVVISRVRETGRIMIGEMYCNGRVEVGGTRVPIYGTYAIRDGMMCRRFEVGGEECARFLRAENGDLYRDWVDSEAAPVLMDLVEIDCD
jgi:hypothetical protein